MLGKNILIIVAHPDDESFLSAGLIRRNHLLGGRNYLVCASLGEKGYMYNEEKKSPSEIKRIRGKELREVSKYLGIHKLHSLHLPDTSLSLHKRKFEKATAKYAKKYKPYYILGFGEDGYTRHKDHIAAGEVAKKVAHALRITFVEFAKPPERTCPNLHKYLIKKRKNGAYKNMNLSPICANLKIKTDPFVKLKALSLHKSQFGGLNLYKIFPTKIADHLLNNEYFYLHKT
jgi:LmbE family N-acetylglucosaminyl deacetylase